MNKGLILTSMLSAAMIAAPAFAEQTGTAAGSIDAGAASGSGDASVVAGAALLAAGIIGGTIALVSDKSKGSTPTASAPTAPSGSAPTGSATGT